MSIRAAGLGRGIVAEVPARAVRPITFEPARAVRPGSPCPFCPVNEVALDSADAGRSTVVALANQYPLGPHHELVLPVAHDAAVHRMDLEEARAFAELLQRRVTAAWSDSAVAHVSAWLSYGAQSGATQDHPHAQVAAWEVPPPGVLDEAEQVGQVACALCDTPEVAEVAGVRVLAGTGAYDGELLLASTVHGRPLAAAAHGPALAAAVRTLHSLFAGCAYSIVWHAFAPARRGLLGHEHVHVQPRLTTLAAVNLVERWTECRTSGQALAELARPDLLRHARQLAGS